MPVPTACNLCGGTVEKRSNADVYGREFGRWPFIYLCLKCGAYVGLHPGTERALGTLADVHTRVARRTLKPGFERIWKERLCSRTQAYKLLAEELGITADRCHWGLFDFDECNAAAKASERVYARLKNKEGKL